jgi:hypothetical protein
LRRYLGERFENGFHRIAILRTAREGAVEIDDMEVACDRIGEQHGLGCGIITINGRTIHIALGEANDLARL